MSGRRGRDEKLVALAVILLLFLFLFMLSWGRSDPGVTDDTAAEPARPAPAVAHSALNEKEQPAAVHSALKEMEQPAATHSGLLKQNDVNSWRERLGEFFSSGMDADFDPRGPAYGHGQPPFFGARISVERFVVRTATTPSFYCATLDPRQEGRGGPSVEMHVQGSWEPEVTAIFHDILAPVCSMDRAPRENPLVVDVGVNIGYFANYAAVHGCRVVGVEPNPGLLDIAYATSTLNGVTNRLRIVPMAVSSKKEQVYMDTLATCPACASVAASKAQANLIVDAAPLTEMLRGEDTRSVALLKIDVDGLEMHVLEGALPLLRQGRVKNILMEITPAWWGRGAQAKTLEEGRDVFKKVLDCGYSVTLAGSGEVLSHDLKWLTADAAPFLWLSLK